MNISCNKTLLENILNKTQRAILPKSTIPALEGILIEAYNNRLKTTGYNLEIGIKCSIDAQIKKEGAFIINSKIFGDIIRKLPDEEVNINVDEKMIVTIKSGMSEFNLTAFLADEFPSIPEVIEENKFRIQKDMLKSVINQTVFAASLAENNTIHTGLKFDFNGEYLNVVAVDGYRLALRKERIFGQNPISFVVPAKALTEVSKILDDGDELIDIIIGKKHILFKFDDTLFVSRLIEGEFLNYNNAIPKTNKIIARANVKALIDSVERASLIISDKLKSPIKLNFNYDSLKISCASQLGRVNEIVPIKLNGEALEIGFNNKYLLDALKSCDQEEVFIELGTALTPCVIKPVKGDSFLFLVLPVKFKND